MLAEAEILGLMLALGDREAEGLKLDEGESEAEGDLEALADKDTLADGELLADGLVDSEGLELAEGDTLADGLAEAEELEDGDWLRLAEALGDWLLLGETEAEAEALGLIEALGLREAEGDPDAEALGDSEALGLREAEGLTEKLAADTAPGAVPYQSTPGRGPGWPSSYRKILSARFRASLGNNDWSIREMTPFFQLLRVKYCGSGKFGLLCFLTCKGITAPSYFRYDLLSLADYQPHHRRCPPSSCPVSSRRPV